MGKHQITDFLNLYKNPKTTSNLKGNKRKGVSGKKNLSLTYSFCLILMSIDLKKSPIKLSGT